MIRFLLTAALLLTAPALAAERPYVTAAQVDLMQLLPPPPAETGGELAQVLDAQATRTPERTAQAVADVQETLTAIYGSVLGDRFAPEAAPLATRLFARLGETEAAVVGPAKDKFARPRPFMIDPDVHPAVPPSRSGSYPSGHATRGTLEGIVLAAMLPELRGPIFARMDDYARSRVIGGAHFPSDVAAGMRAGTAIAAVLFDDPGFRAEFEPARRELRAAIGLGE